MVLKNSWVQRTAFLVVLLLALIAAPGEMVNGDPLDKAGGYVTISGTHVSLMRPADFAPAVDFPGFLQKSTFSSIMVTELPAPYRETTAGFSKETLAQHGMTLLAKEAHPLGDGPGLFFHVTQQAAGIVFEKWIYCFGDAQQTILVTATFPQEFAPKLSEPLKASVLQVKWDKERQVDPLTDLRFRITPQPPLKFAKRLGNTLLLTAGGEFPAHSPENPFFSAGYALAEAAPTDKKAFSLQRLQQMPVLRQTVLNTHPIRIDGLAGYETVAKGFDKKTQVPVALYQVMLFDGKTYILMFGITGAIQAERDIPMFRATANTFRRK